MAERRERMVQECMRVYGLSRADAEQLVAIELGESEGDVVRTDREEPDDDGTGQKQE